jgi:hypothetical protein
MAADVLPYVAVLGVSALAVYGISKIVRFARDMDFPLDFGNDMGLASMYGKKDE